METFLLLLCLHCILFYYSSDLANRYEKSGSWGVAIQQSCICRKSSTEQCVACNLVTFCAVYLRIEAEKISNAMYLGILFFFSFFLEMTNTNQSCLYYQFSVLSRQCLWICSQGANDKNCLFWMKVLFWVQLYSSVGHLFQSVGFLCSKDLQFVVVFNFKLSFNKHKKYSSVSFFIFIVE